jgi:tetratricopeptide (TPR) repeat protein
MQALSRVAAAAACVMVAACQPDSPEATETPPTASQYVGSTECAGCHQAETAGWLGSHHDLAMQPADESTVLGDFNDAEFSYGDRTSSFFRRDGGFWVRTEGASGALEEFEIQYTFGAQPLQQYLIAFPAGRFQALTIAWDSRAAAQGGARWFHLYPGSDIDATDPLHWTRTAQNWNTACADCHSTDLRKNYAPADGTFATEWSDIDVGCEACHGPGSKHAANPILNAMTLPRSARTWAFQNDTGIAVRVPPAGANVEVPICAQCHSRRSQFADEGTFLDAYRPELLEPDLYHADGQILDEVYVVGSFLQSAMHGAGVTCSDCHDPHSQQLRAVGNALCGQCHLPTRFDTENHHRHAMGGAGSQCVDCHMPARTYMVVDPRRDHSFRVPRPDLSERLGTPNACNGCHVDRTVDWAADSIANWYPDGRHTQFHYGEALAAGRNWAADRGDLLSRIVADPRVPAIVRATGVELLSAQLDDRALDLVARQLNDDDALVRLAALDALADAPPAFLAASAQRFLTDPLRVLRMAAARVLIPARDELSARRRADLDQALEEYHSAQIFNMDRAEGHFNWGAALLALGRPDEAQRSFRDAIEREPTFAPAYVNLADLLRRDGREADAQSLLRDAAAIVADDPNIHFALALSLVRSEQRAAAVDQLARAVELAPQAPQFQYALGLALYSTDEPERGLDILRQAHERFPGHANILAALATMLRDRGEIDAAIDYARKLVGLSTNDATAQRLLSELQALR